MKPLVSVLIFLALSGSLAAAEKTLERIEDPVIVEGKELKPLLGAKPEELSLMAWTGEGFEPVPFQVDERDAEGEYVYTMSVEGDKIAPSTAADQDPGLDSNDELVFMVFDTGDRCPEGSFPDGAEKGAEIDITDPVDGGKAWIYLFAFKNEPPRSELDYVKSIIDSRKKVQRIQARNYINEYVQNALYYNYISIVHSDGTRSPDLVDRLKMRAVVSVAFDIIKIPFALDEIVKSEIVAVKDGPIRVLTQGQGYLEGPANIRMNAGRSVLLNYPGFFILPIHLYVPLDADLLLSDVDLHGENDFNENAYGMYYYDEHNPWNPEVVLDGRMSRTEKDMDYKSDREWLVVTGPQGTFVGRAVYPSEWDFVNKGLYYVDDPGFEDAPEDNPGSIAVGFNMENYIALKKGAFDYCFHGYFPQDFKVGDERMILDIMDRPLKVKVIEMSKDAQ